MEVECIRAARRLASRLALATCGLLAGVVHAHVCPQPVRAISIAHGEAEPNSPEYGVTQFMTEATAALLERAGVQHTVQVVPYARAAKELEVGGGDVLMISEGSVQSLRAQLVSVPLLRLQVTLYEPKAPTSEPRKTGVLRGFPPPPSLRLDESRTHTVTSYDSLFQMLGAGRLSAAIAVRPTADLYLAHHPEVAQRIRAGRLIEGRLMAIHFSKRLPAACLRVLVDTVRSDGAGAVRSAFDKWLPGLRFEDFYTAVSVPSTGTN
jgi:hypothetical protein